MITKEAIDNDPAFKWYAESLRIYPRPDSSAVAAFRRNEGRKRTWPHSRIWKNRILG
jgi:hypothetical protein